MTAYYNEHDPFAAAWLRELIKRDLIAPGIVDERSIVEVQPGDLAGYTQCHFFAGIGVWSHALRLAGWADGSPVWTGSCPCQPFSAAGKGEGSDDSRHLWPAWFRLIQECRPHVVFGEQVAGADGRAWLEVVSTDLEGVGYAIGATDLCAAGVGAPHIRQRLYWLAESERARLEGQRPKHQLQASGGAVEADWGNVPGRGLGVTDSGGRQAAYVPVRSPRQDEAAPVERRAGCWSTADWIPCADGKARPVESGTFPLADGAPARVGRLRGYGNAIVAQVAAAFIEAYLDVRETA